MKGKSFLGLAPWLERPKLGSERAGLISDLWQAPYHGELSLWIPYHDRGGRRVVGFFHLRFFCTRSQRFQVKEEMIGKTVLRR